MFTGFVVYDGPSQCNGLPIVGILTFKCNATKLTTDGEMPQLWILSQRVKPNAVRPHSDLASSVCGRCPLQGNGCYVTRYRAPRAIWECWKRGGYPDLPDGDLGAYCDTSVLRLGADGDPAMLPFEVVLDLATRFDVVLGYTRQWMELWFDSRHLLHCMAAAITTADVTLAEAMGIRWYGPHEHENAVACPYYTKGIVCKECKLCRGNSMNAKSILSQPHGYAQSSFEAVAASV